MQTINDGDFNKVVSKLQEFMQYSQRLQSGDSYLIVNRNSPVLTLAAQVATRNYGLYLRTFDLSSDTPYRSFPQELLRLLREETPKGGMSLFDYSSHPDWNLKEQGARVELLYGTLEQVPISWAHSPGITIDMAVNGPIQCDYRAMAEQAERMLQLLTGLDKIHITSSGGTDIEICISPTIRFDTDCIIVPPNIYGKPGKIGNLPVGEVWAERGEEIDVRDTQTGQNIKQHYPIKLNANGLLVCDVCVGGYQQRIDPRRPIRVEFRDGLIIRYSCDEPALQALHEYMLTSEKRYEKPTVLGEVGIGFNDRARVTGNMLEDEKLGGTCHLALGNIRVHEDMLVDKPTINVTYIDGRRAIIMEKGTPLN